MSPLASCRLLILCAAAAVCGAHAQGTQKAAKGPEPLEIKLVRTKVILVGGKEIRESAATANPGEILEEVATYTNKSASMLKSLAATLPVPQSTELVGASATPGNAQASIDGKEFSAMPLKRKTRRADGIESEQLIPLSEYRFLRWYVEALRPASSVVFSARFKVSNDAAQTVSAGDGKK